MYLNMFNCFVENVRDMYDYYRNSPDIRYLYTYYVHLYMGFFNKEKVTALKMYW